MCSNASNRVKWWIILRAEGITIVLMKYNELWSFYGHALFKHWTSTLFHLPHYESCSCAFTIYINHQVEVLATRTTINRMKLLTIMSARDNFSVVNMTVYSLYLYLYHLYSCTIVGSICDVENELNWIGLMVII